MNTPTTTGKDVLYIDIDDEITAVIDKVRSSQQKIVALVLPKRAAVMQSIVNMKLLKRTADEAKKHIVLITTEVGLLPLAAHVGLHVAKSLQSRPEIPTVAGIATPPQADEDDAFSISHDQQLDNLRPVGEYAAQAASPLAAPGIDEDEAPIELDDTQPQTDSAGTLPAAGKQSASKKDKKLAIPDFNKFRLLIIAGVAALLVIIVGLYFALAVMPSAAIAVKTDSSAVPISTDVTLSAQTTKLDVNDNIVPATLQQVQKTQNQQVDATGQKDIGERATGSMKFYNCNQMDTLAGNDRTIPAGTGVSANGLTFITAESVVVPPSNFDGNGCKKNKSSSAIKVVAQAAGEKYNVSAADYSVASSGTITGQGSAMAGGTSKVLKIVQQSDIDIAKQKISTQDSAAIKGELKAALQAKDLYAVEETFTPGANPELTTSVNVGAEADSVTVTQKTTYTMLGASQNDLKKVIGRQVEQKIDKNKQSILDYGLSGASFRMQNQQGANTLVAMSATSIAGSDLNLADIKKQIAGKKASDAKDIIGAYPGVTKVTVKYSPFWVSSIPKKTSKITITVEKPEVKNASTQ
jgi:hypothetical protein